MNRASRPVTDLVILKQETKELEDFIDIHLMPIKEALYYVGMETIDYQQLFDLIREVEQDAYEYTSRYPKYDYFQKINLQKYYDQHPDAQQRKYLLKHYVDLVLELRPIPMSSQRYLEIWNIEKLFTELTYVVDYIYVTETKDRLARVYDTLRTLCDIQDRYYRYQEPSHDKYRFARFDARLDEIRTRNATILQAFDERNLGYYSIGFLYQQTLEMKVELQEYVWLAMLRTTFQVFVKSLNMQVSINLDIDFYDTIGILKQRIENKMDMMIFWDHPSTQFDLIFNGEQLSDEKTIGDYPITKYSRIDIVYRL
jgi:hypothetical protein